MFSAEEEAYLQETKVLLFRNIQYSCFVNQLTVDKWKTSFSPKRFYIHCALELIKIKKMNESPLLLSIFRFGKMATLKSKRNLAPFQEKHRRNILGINRPETRPFSE